MTDAKLMQRVLKELHEIQANCPEGIRVHINEQNVTEVQAEMDGPEGTPYEGGVFKLKLTCPSDYPNVPPKGFFSTKIFHPNVSTSGEICVNVLKKDWTPDMGLKHVLVVIKCLLVHTNPESALNEEAGRLLLEDYEEFARHARLMTSIHAQRRPGPLTTSAQHAANMQPAVAEGSQAAEKQQQAQPSSPAAKKAKAEAGAAGAVAAATKPAAASAAGKVKKSLRRL